MIRIRRCSTKFCTSRRLSCWIWATREATVAIRVIASM
jgi:hypothetical protein